MAGVEVTAVSPKGFAELCELVESEGGLGDVRVELEFTAYPSRLQDGAAGQILDAVRAQAAARRAMRWSRSRMVWSEQDAAWADGIAVAKQYAAAHEHFLPPTAAVREGHPIGVWAKNARAAARRARENEELRAAGRPVRSAAGAMTQARRDELDAIDPGWCPAWDTKWQRCYRLVQNHVQADGTLPEAAGDVVVQSERYSPAA
ncbi:helicase associated domain-containing protein [Streptomyces sp. NPDC087228]|uniref:helicase associated domain-containing protein n=1 Tax=Streptomyces sp. NPDC087228 TaxID=3365772 RepID=UPI003807966E